MRFHSFFLVLINLVNGIHCIKENFHHVPPETNMNISQIIVYNGYPCENHEVLTDDGYILSVQRIPHGKANTSKGNRGPVFLQHGLVDSAATWAMNSPEQSLAFVLADQGYDVWLGNSRGNTYSRKHVKYTTKDAEFWDFSFDEMAKHDLPASINYVLNVTKQVDLYYIGHSQGTMIGFIEFGRNPDLAKKVKKFIALAPVATVGHIKGALKFLSYFAPEVEWLVKILGIHEFLPSNWLVKIVAEGVCGIHWTEKICGNFIFLLCGFDTKNLNDSRVPVYLAHNPAGTSVKDVVHFVQLIKSKTFRAYDYGSAGNMKRYGQPTPPAYDITRVQTPVALFTATEDWLADPFDVENTLVPNLPNIIYRKNMVSWNHLDFVWGEDAYDVIYKDVIRLMEPSGGAA